MTSVRPVLIAFAFFCFLGLYTKVVNPQNVLGVGRKCQLRPCLVCFSRWLWHLALCNASITSVVMLAFQPPTYLGRCSGGPSSVCDLDSLRHGSSACLFHSSLLSGGSAGTVHECVATLRCLLPFLFSQNPIKLGFSFISIPTQPKMRVPQERAPL